MHTRMPDASNHVAVVNSSDGLTLPLVVVEEEEEEEEGAEEEEEEEEEE